MQLDEYAANVMVSHKVLAKFYARHTTGIMIENIKERVDSGDSKQNTDSAKC